MCRTFDHFKHGWIFLENQMSCISTIIQDHIGLPVFGCDASIDTPPEILFRLATPGENGEPCQQKTKQYKRGNDISIV
jgi:hypothetical protein